MNSLLYPLFVSLIWGLFYALYVLLLRHETFHGANRAYLLGVLGLGLVMPLLPNFEIQREATNATALVLAPVAAVRTGADSLLSASKPFEWTLLQFFWVLYGIGVGIAAYRFFTGLRHLRRLTLQYGREKTDAGYYQVDIPGLNQPFSFFNTLFWGCPADAPAHDRELMRMHELAHMRQRHSVDVVILELLQALFWWNPLIYKYNRALRVVHELSADEAALRHTDIQYYGRLLIGQAQSGPVHALANHFFHSQLKQRIFMMTRAKSHPARGWMYALAAPLAVFLFSISNVAETLGQNKTGFIYTDGIEDAYQVKYGVDTFVTFDPSTYEETRAISLGELHSQVEKLPRFAGVDHVKIGCENLSPGERDTCAQQAFARAIQSKLVIPDEVKSGKVKGRVVIKARTVNGALFFEAITKSLTPACDKAAVTAVFSLKSKWIHATVKGKTVDCIIYIPVDF